VILILSENYIYEVHYLIRQRSCLYQVQKGKKTWSYCSSDAL